MKTNSNSGKCVPFVNSVIANSYLNKLYYWAIDIKEVFEITIRQVRSFESKCYFNISWLLILINSKIWFTNIASLHQTLFSNIFKLIIENDYFPQIYIRISRGFGVSRYFLVVVCLSVCAWRAVSFFWLFEDIRLLSLNEVQWRGRSLAFLMEQENQRDSRHCWRLHLNVISWCGLVPGAISLRKASRGRSMITLASR